MSRFSEKYTQVLSEKTGLSPSSLSCMEVDIIKKVNEALNAAANSQPSKNITGKNLAAVLREKSFKFI